MVSTFPALLARHLNSYELPADKIRRVVSYVLCSNPYFWNFRGSIDPMFENIRIVLIGTSHPGNIGATARAMKSMGLSRLHLVTPKTFPAAAATAMASGADDVLANAQVHETLDQALVGCSRVYGASARLRSLRWPQANPREAAPDLLGHAQTGEVAIVFGREDAGLTNEEMDRCQALLHIPSDPQFKSLNLAASVQVVSYELRMQALIDEGVAATTEPSSDDTRKRLAHVDEVEGLFEHLEQALTYSGFLDPEDPRYLMRRLRRLFARTQLFIDEVHILRGVANSILKLKR